MQNGTKLPCSVLPPLLHPHLTVRISMCFRIKTPAYGNGRVPSYPTNTQCAVLYRNINRHTSVCSERIHSNRAKANQNRISYEAPGGIRISVPCAAPFINRLLSVLHGGNRKSTCSHHRFSFGISLCMNKNSISQKHILVKPFFTVITISLPHFHDSVLHHMLLSDCTD